ncbi:glycine betaine ABC transporter substrate-binding protein [Ilyobacter polytropus]|uniref:Substrate-binding region of ABC-type glycine betaine transport system n=1 Tax=Ilyobacter polytropus (strain ATCC 51220 / DSM 2926 / LMG 16218 / CuHBu1) TaxID=572544 RepID=E3H6B9_ILYPC|nr:glycine betaine ABC transporter substrate-binding protein [Ilyobacter polytropus]ADO82332.1 Substrate-binding region of ABC-type glycine betaine transport system [Ilyobacter polytropus DSM 2926]
MVKLLKRIVLVMMIVVFAACGKKEAKLEMITLGHTNFTEQRVLGQLFAVMIENHTDYKTDVKELGGTKIAFEAIKTGDISIYPHCTGTGYSVILKQTELKDPDAVYEYVKNAYAEKKYNLEYLKPLGFNDTYTLAIKPETAEKYNLKTFSDLAKVSEELVIGATMEFLEREDGVPGLKKAYPGMEFKGEKALEGGLRYTAIKEDKIDIADAFSTDGKLLTYNLVILEDDKNFFPPYYAAPLLNGEFAKNHPEIKEVLEKLAEQINENDMQNMNYRADEEGIPARVVAEEFLKGKGLI